MSTNSDPDKLVAKANKLTRLSLTRWSTDWKEAAVLYEKAANTYKLKNKYEEAKIAFEKASQGQEILSSPWDAAKLMESSAAIAKEMCNWSEIVDKYKKASELYKVCERYQAASDALSKGARAVEEASPIDAAALYSDACTVLEEDGRGQMTFDLYHALTRIYIKMEKFCDAATCLLKLGSTADKCSATNTQCKAYLSAILLYLYTHDLKEAEKCYNDCSQVDVFQRSDQGRCAARLLSFYSEADIDGIKALTHSTVLSHLDSSVIKIARKLPTGDVNIFKKDVEDDDIEDDLM